MISVSFPSHNFPGVGVGVAVGQIILKLPSLSELGSWESPGVIALLSILHPPDEDCTKERVGAVEGLGGITVAVGSMGFKVAVGSVAQSLVPSQVPPQPSPHERPVHVFVAQLQSGGHVSAGSHVSVFPQSGQVIKQLDVTLDGQFGVPQNE
jgi:hypothetical protein